MFFDLHTRGRLAGLPVTLSDNNRDLIACYRVVRDSPDHVINELSHLARDHERGGSDHYYDVRNNRFNPERARLAAASNDAFAYSPALGAMFIYLNRTGYNGLFRLNADGQFNVPAGRYPHPHICDESNLRRVADALGRPGRHARARAASIVSSKKRARVTFCISIHRMRRSARTSRFTSYTQEGFGRDDQQRLRDVVFALDERGCHVVVSNSTAPEISELYESGAPAGLAGLRCYRVPARRAINSNASRRGAVDEYVIANVGQNQHSLL